MLLKNLTPGSLYVEDLLFYNFETKEIPYEQWASKYSKSIQIKKLIKEKKMASSVPVAEAINEIQTVLPPGVSLTTYRNPYRGTVETLEDLPMERNYPGDWFEVYSEVSARYWNGESWVSFGGGDGAGTVSHDSTLEGSGTPENLLKVSNSITENLVPENGVAGQIIEADADGKAQWKDKTFLTVDTSVEEVLAIDEKYKLKAKDSSFVTDNGVPVWMNRMAYGNGENYLLVWNADQPINTETWCPTNTALGASKVTVSILEGSPSLYHWTVTSDVTHNGTPVYRTGSIQRESNFVASGKYNAVFADGSSIANHNTVLSMFVNIAVAETNKMLFGESDFTGEGGCWEFKTEIDGSLPTIGLRVLRPSMVDFYKTVNIDEWHHVLCSFEKSTKRWTFYLDGVKLHSFLDPRNPSIVYGYTFCYPNIPKAYLDQIQWWEVDDEEIKLYQGDTIAVPTSESGVTSKITTEILSRQPDESFNLWGQSERGLVRVTPQELVDGNISVATIKSINGNSAVLSVGTLNDNNQLVSDKEVTAILGWENA